MNELEPTLERPPKIKVQSRDGRPTVEQLRKASCIKITDSNQDVYELRWSLETINLTILGGMFSEGRVPRDNFNTVINVPEVVFAIAGGGRYVDLLLGSNSPFKKAYVRLGIQEVEVVSEEN